MGSVFFVGGKIGMNVPVAGIPLSEFPEGTIIMIPENGVDVPFILSKHEYESSLNGVGRVLLTRKSCYGSMSWHNTGVNAYASSDIDSWLNGTYKVLFPTIIQEAMGTTKFRYTAGNGNTSVGTLSRSVFLPSITELGGSDQYLANVEGSALPTLNLLRGVDQWTRSPRLASHSNALYLTSGNAVEGGYCSDKHGIRPQFTLPDTTLVDAEPNADGSVNLKV